ALTDALPHSWLDQSRRDGAPDSTHLARWRGRLAMEWMMGPRQQFVALLFLSGLAAAPSLAAEGHRELGAHEHGRGTLNIAIEGTKVTMELEVPGADIVGFEHAAKSPKEKSAVEKATIQLKSPLALFNLPPTAACRITEAKVEVEKGGHDHDAKPAGADKAAEKDDGHSE